jgi:hypothetical protein
MRNVVVSASRPGFQWFDAALGFGFACGAMLLGAGALAIKRRRRVIRADVAV